MATDPLKFEVRRHEEGYLQVVFEGDVPSSSSFEEVVFTSPSLYGCSDEGIAAEVAEACKYAFQDAVFWARKNPGKIVR